MLVVMVAKMAMMMMMVQWLFAMIYDWNDDADAWIAVGEALSLTCPGFQTRGLQGAAKREGESEDCHRH